MNYQSILEDTLSEISNKYNRVPTLLLHSCCGPCSSYCVSYLLDRFDITVFYYNPNIYPESEFNHRLNEQKKLINQLNILDGIEFDNQGIFHERVSKIKLIAPGYDHFEFVQCINGLENEPEGGKRCRECFKLRLEKTAHEAKENRFDFFGTTLSVSPHKNAVVINEVGIEAESSISGGLTQFLISDFKKKNGYKISIELSKRFDLYRQNYCGCEFSMV